MDGASRANVVHWLLRVTVLLLTAAWTTKEDAKDANYGARLIPA